MRDRLTTLRCLAFALLLLSSCGRGMTLCGTAGFAPCGVGALLSIAITSSISTGFPIGVSKSYRAIAYYDNNTSADISYQVTWVVSGTGTVSITYPVAPGDPLILTGATLGNITVRYTTSTGLTGYTNDTVTSALIQTVTITNATVHQGETEQLVATAHFDDGSSYNVTSNSTWVSLTPASLSVNATGLVTAIAAVGAVTVQATFAGTTGNSTVTLGAPMTAIDLTPNSYGMDYDSIGSVQFTATATYSDASTGDVTTKAHFSTSYSGVTVSSTGMASFSVPDPGEDNTDYYTITASYMGFSDTSTVSIDGEDDSVICTELHRQGMLPTEIYMADDAYGKNLIDLETLRNYQAWAKLVVKLMRVSPLVTSLVRPVGQAWANHMAYLMGVRSEPDSLGKFLLDYAPPVSNAMGRTLRALRPERKNRPSNSW